MVERLVNMIFPIRCPMCENIIVQKGKMICEDCDSKAVIIKEAKCEKCGKALLTGERLYCSDCNVINHKFKKGVSVFEHEGALRESVYRFKYNNAREYADYYGKVAAEVYERTFVKWGIDVIVPVPLYKNKEIKRGYNQAKVFADSISKYTGIPVDAKCLIRRKSTVPQKELSIEMRKANLEKAFAVDDLKVLKYKNILLVDDIYTTGSTIDACAKVLMAAGVENVYFVCISTGRNKNEE